MSDSKIPLQKLMENAKSGIISRDAYIEKMLSRISDALNYYFVDRMAGKNTQCSMIETAVSKLQLPIKWVDECCFKDLVFVIYHYYISENEELRNLAYDSLMKLSDIAINNYYNKML